MKSLALKPTFLWWQAVISTKSKERLFDFDHAGALETKSEDAHSQPMGHS